MPTENEKPTASPDSSKPYPEYTEKYAQESSPPLNAPTGSVPTSSILQKLLTKRLAALRQCATHFRTVRPNRTRAQHDDDASQTLSADEKWLIRNIATDPFPLPFRNKDELRNLVSALKSKSLYVPPPRHFSEVGTTVISWASCLPGIVRAREEFPGVYEEYLLDFAGRAEMLRSTDAQDYFHNPDSAVARCLEGYMWVDEEEGRR